MTAVQALAIAPSFPELARIEEACRLLAEARSIDDVKAIRDMAEAARVYARQAQLGLQAQNHAAEIKLRAERRAGELLAEMPKNRGTRLGGRTLIPPDDTPRLADVGVSAAQSHRFQAIASLPLQMFEEHIADTHGRGQELTSAGTLRLAAGQQRAARALTRVPAASPGARSSRVSLLVGDVRAGLAALAAESVQTVPTSVPYWGLRSYGTVPQVWGGEPGHPHKWGGPLRSPWANEVPGPNTGGKNHARNCSKISGQNCGCGAWLGELGNEPTPGLYVEHIVEVFRHIRRVLRKDGTVWLNIGFSYAGSGKGPTGWNGASDQEQRQGFTGGLQRIGPQEHTNGAGRVTGYKPKDLIPIPWLVAMALQQDGWYWRSTIAWCKTAPMPESVDDRPTSAWEPILLLSKSAKYLYDKEAVAEDRSHQTHARRASDAAVSLNGKQGDRGDGVKANVSFHTATGDVLPTRNMRNVWLLGPEPFPGAHFAVFPTEVPRRCILAGSRPGDLVLDPFSGAGTTSMVAARLGRDSIGIDLKPEYVHMARDRIQADGGFTVDVELQEVS